MTETLEKAIAFTNLSDIVLNMLPNTDQTIRNRAGLVARSESVWILRNGSIQYALLARLTRKTCQGGICFDCLPVVVATDTCM